MTPTRALRVWMRSSRELTVMDEPGMVNRTRRRTLQRRQPVERTRRRGHALGIGVYHHLDERGEVDRRLPAELCTGLRAVADQMLDFGGANQLRIEGHVRAPLEACVAEGDLDQIAYGVADAGGDHVVVGAILLHHQIH